MHVNIHNHMYWCGVCSSVQAAAIQYELRLSALHRLLRLVKYTLAPF